MFPIVELTKLGEQNFKLERYSENIEPIKGKVNWNRYFKTFRAGTSEVITNRQF